MSENSVLSEDNSSGFVLDTWPVMEWFRRREPGRARFAALLALATQQKLRLHMSRMNLGEAYYNVAKDFGLAQADSFRTSFQYLPIQIEPVSDADVDEAAGLKARHKLSYADAFAVALALRLEAVVVTGDRDFLALKTAGLLQVYWVGA